MGFDPRQIMNLVGQVGGNHQGVASQLQNMMANGRQVDPVQHADMLQQAGIDPQQLASGGYQQHFDAQNDPGFQGVAGDLSASQSGYGADQGGQY